MNKTISITIAGLVFNIEEDAYSLLHNYLDSIKKHFSAQSYGQEVYSDIEARVAEQFSKKIHETKVQVITAADVENLQKTMGTVADFGVESKTDADAKTERKLYRNTDDAMIAGVASGIAAFFGWDTTLIRLLFAVTVFMGGWGVILYIILWLVVPPAQTSSEKLAMQGHPVTLKKLEQTVKERLDEGSSTAKKSASFAGHFIRQLFYLILRLVKTLMLIIVTVLGAAFTVGFLILAVTLTFFFVILLFNRHSPYIDSGILQIFAGIKYFLVLTSAYLTSIIPAILLSILGLTIIHRKTVIDKKIFGSLAVIWLVGALTLGTVMFRSAPQIEAQVNNEATQIASKQYDIKDFQQINIEGNFAVNITQSPEFSITARGQEKYLGEMLIQRQGDTLVINQNQRFRICLFCIHREITMDISMPTVNSIRAAASVSVKSDNLQTDKFNLNLASGSRANLNIQTKDLIVKVSSASRADLTGSTVNAVFEASSGSRIISEVTVTDNLNADASSASHMQILNTANLKAMAFKASSGSRFDVRASADKTQLDLSSSSGTELIGKTASLSVRLSSGSRFNGYEFVANSADVNASSSSRATINALESLKARASSGSYIDYLGQPKVDADEDSSGRIHGID